jgi:hypothetical protein
LSNKFGFYRARFVVAPGGVQSFAKRPLIFWQRICAGRLAQRLDGVIGFARAKKHSPAQQQGRRVTALELKSDVQGACGFVVRSRLPQVARQLGVHPRG